MRAARDVGGKGAFSLDVDIRAGDGVFVGYFARVNIEQETVALALVARDRSRSTERIGTLSPRLSPRRRITAAVEARGFLPPRRRGEATRVA